MTANHEESPTCKILIDGKRRKKNQDQSQKNSPDQKDSTTRMDASGENHRLRSLTRASLRRVSSSVRADS
jgi:hypothetical protein